MSLDRNIAFPVDICTLTVETHCIKHPEGVDSLVEMLWVHESLHPQTAGLRVEGHVLLCVPFSTKLPTPLG